MLSKPKTPLLKVLALNLIVIVGTVVISAPFQSVGHQFKEGGIITYFSVVQLFILSYLAYLVFKARADGFKHPWHSSIAIWGIASLGFSFLALDDWLSIHEKLDMLIHRVGQFQETGVSDRIDDLIVGLYGVMAVGLLVIYRRELMRYKSVLGYVVIGFVLMFLMVGIDVVTNRDDLLILLFSRETTTFIMGWIFVPEESFKLFSEAFLIVAVHRCYEIAKHLNSGAVSTLYQPAPAAVRMPQQVEPSRDA